MTSKGEKVAWKRTPLRTSDVDYWLKEKKKLDGAEGFWRIHDKLYDFTIWSRIHPGGKFWLDQSRGTDITEAFESHHFSKKPESLLQNYYKREASTPRNSPTVFHENGFYKTFKRKISNGNLMGDEVTRWATSKRSLAVPFINDGIAILVFLTGILGANYGLPWIFLSGVLLGILSVASHSFFHTKESWRIYYFSLSLMSSRDWRIRHVLSHHQYRNTFSDLELPIWSPFLSNKKGIAKYVRLTLNVLQFPVVAHIQFVRRFSDVFLSQKLGFHQEELVAFSLPLFMFFFSRLGPWKVFLTWNLIISVGSCTFCLLSSGFFTGENYTELESSDRGKEDFGSVQLYHIRGHPNKSESILSFLNAFRSNALHYLCPILHWSSFNKLIPVFVETIDEYGFTLAERSEGFRDGLDKIKETAPQGHLFFS